MRRSFATVKVATVCLVLGAALGCQKAPAPAPSSDIAPVPSSPKAADPSRLPEDAAAGRRATEQWRQHLDQEERERQLGFDRHHLKEHEAVVALLKAARERYDHATKASDVAKAREQVARDVDAIKARVHELDHWGNNSRLLPDYDALESALTASYPDAKEAALKGNTTALATERTTFDGHLKTIAAWLKESEESEEGESDRERKDGKDKEEGKEKEKR